MADTVSKGIRERLARFDTDRLQMWWRNARHLVHGAVRTRFGGGDDYLPVGVMAHIDDMACQFPLSVTIRFTARRGAGIYQAVVPLDARDAFQRFAAELHRELRQRGKHPRWAKKALP